MDTVKGKRGVTKSCLLVLTERMTRNELVFKLDDQKSDSVVNVLNRLERKWGDMFGKLFKTITVDNGVEFSDCSGMEKSILHPGKRTNLYYCHPYSSWERGSNENNNRLVRRHVPKGTDFDNITSAEVSNIESWMNNYPRKIFNYRTSKQLFDVELAKIF
jgi:IS30 family transposase